MAGHGYTYGYTGNTTPPSSTRTTEDDDDNVETALIFISIAGFVLSSGAAMAAFCIWKPRRAL